MERSEVQTSVGYMVVKLFRSEVEKITVICCKWYSRTEAKIFVNGKYWICLQWLTV